ncbi:epoxide hydrolase 4-like [Ciona intestinalis]
MSNRALDIFLGLCYYGVGCFWASIVVPVVTVYTLLGGRQRVNKFFTRGDHSKLPEVASCVKVNHDFIQTESGNKFHYVHLGEKDKPLMIILHGFPDCWYTWRHMMKQYSDRYYVVLFEMRGYGDSCKPEGINKYHMDYLVNDVAEVIEALGYPRATLVAHDWGGAIAWEVPKYFPHLVDKVIIMNAPVFSALVKCLSQNPIQFLKSWYIFLFQLPWIPELLITCNDYGVLKDAQKNLTSEEVNVFKHCVGRHITYPINYYRGRNPIYQGLGLPQKCKQVTQPLLLIWGDKDTALDKILIPYCKEHATNIKVCMVEGATHWVMQDEPDIVYNEMDKFLKI